MKTADELRSEAGRMREFALDVTDSEVLEEIEVMIAELERRARALGDGDAGDADREVRSDHSGAEDAAECDPVSISRILFANASAACKEQKSPTTAPCNSGLIAVPSEVPAACVGEPEAAGR